MAKTELTKAWLSKSQACVCCGISQRAFERDFQPQLADDKTVKRGRALFVHMPSLVAAIVSKAGATAEALKKERVKGLRLQNELKQFDVDERKRLLCRVEDLERVWSMMAIPFRRVTDELKKTYGDGAARIWQAAIEEAVTRLEEFTKTDDSSG